MKCYSVKEKQSPFLLYKTKPHGFVLPLFPEESLQATEFPFWRIQRMVKWLQLWPSSPKQMVSSKPAVRGWECPAQRCSHATWFSNFRLSQKHSLRCNSECKEFIWEAIPGNTSPGIRKLRKGRPGRVCYQYSCTVSSFNIIPWGNSRKRANTGLRVIPPEGGRQFPRWLIPWHLSPARTGAEQSVSLSETASGQETQTPLAGGSWSVGS